MGQFVNCMQYNILFKYPFLKFIVFNHCHHCELLIAILVSLGIKFVELSLARVTFIYLLQNLLYYVFIYMFNVGFPGQVFPVVILIFFSHCHHCEVLIAMLVSLGLKFIGLSLARVSLFNLLQNLLYYVFIYIFNVGFPLQVSPVVILIFPHSTSNLN